MRARSRSLAALLAGEGDEGVPGPALANPELQLPRCAGASMLARAVGVHEHQVGRLLGRSAEF